MRRAAIALLISACTPSDDFMAGFDVGTRVEPSCSYVSSRVADLIFLGSTGVCDSSADLHVKISDVRHALITGLILHGRECPWSEDLQLSMVPNVDIYVDVGMVPVGTTQWFGCRKVK